MIFYFDGNDINLLFWRKTLFTWFLITILIKYVIVKHADVEIMSNWVVGSHIA